MTDTLERDVADAAEDSADTPTTTNTLRRRELLERAWIYTARLGVLVLFLLAWQFLPSWLWLRSLVGFMDPFYLSSPTQVLASLGQLLGITEAPASGGMGLIWMPLWNTLRATFIGTFAGMVIGLVLGVSLSGSRVTGEIFRPFIVAADAIPRIALIPIIVIMFGPTLTSANVSSAVVVIFVVFYNAFAGGRSVGQNVVRNASLLGAGRWAITFQLRLPYAVAWVFAALPLAISSGLIGAVTSELFSGTNGIGSILIIATGTLNSTLTMSVIVVLCIVGLALVSAAIAVQRRVLHWWENPTAV